MHAVITSTLATFARRVRGRPVFSGRNWGGETPKWLRARIADSAAVAVVTTTSLALVFRFWDLPLRSPFSYARDGISQLAAVKGMIENGWHSENPGLGFPFGQTHYDFPLGPDNLHWLIIRFLALFSSDAILVTNIYFLLSFVLVALAAFFCLRSLHASRPAAMAAAVLYSFLPYHFLRGTGHLPLAAYWAVPIACVIIIRLNQDPPPFLAQRGGHWRVDTSRRSLLLAAGALAIASTSLYYSAFFLVLGVTSASIRALVVRSARPLVAMALLGSLVVTGLGLNTAPSLLYQQRHGRNPDVIKRTAAESDFYALRPVQLLMPVPGHRIDRLSELTAKSFTAPNNSEGTSYLGIVGSAGFVALLVTALSAVAGRPVRAVSANLALPVLPSLLFAVTGGLSWLFALGGLVQIRAWNRVSVFIAFFSLAAIAQLLDSTGRRWSAKGRARWAPALVAGSIVLIGLADQTNAVVVPDPRRFAAEFEADAEFTDRIEREMGPGDAVFQLPYLPYPEAELDRPPGLGDYDPFRGYLHSRTLRWSYGGMRGRESDWQVTVVRNPPDRFLDAIVAVGYRGLWLDRSGYSDAGRTLVSEFTRILQSSPLESRHSRFAFFSLQGFAEGQRSRLSPGDIALLKDRVLSAPTVKPGPGISESAGSGLSVMTGDSEGQLAVTNRRPKAQHAVLTAGFSIALGSGTLTITTGGSSRQIRLTSNTRTERLPLVLPPGTTSIGFNWRPDPGGAVQWRAQHLVVQPR